jgi:hypothetical protein
MAPSVKASKTCDPLGRSRFLRLVLSFCFSCGGDDDAAGSPAEPVSNQGLVLPRLAVFEFLAHLFPGDVKKLLHGASVDFGGDDGVDLVTGDVLNPGQSPMTSHRYVADLTRRMKRTGSPLAKSN